MFFLLPVIFAKLCMIYVSLSLSILTTMKFRLIASINHLIKLHFKRNLCQLLILPTRKRHTKLSMFKSTQG